MKSASPHPFLRPRHRNEVVLVKGWSGMVKVVHFLTNSIFYLKSIGYKKAVKVVKVVKVNSYLLRMRAHVFCFSSFIFSFIEKTPDHLDQASNNSTLHLDRLPCPGLTALTTLSGGSK